MPVIQRAADFETKAKFSCVFDAQSCLPIEPVQRFLNFSRKRGLAPNTITTYAYRLNDFWEWIELNLLDWRSVNLRNLADFTHWYLLGGEAEDVFEGRPEVLSKRSARTVNQALTVIRELYDFHAAEGRVDVKAFTRLSQGKGRRAGFLQGIAKSNPERLKVIKLREPKVFPGCLTDDQVVRLASACFSHRDRLIVMLLRETGIRRGELLGLYLEDVQDLAVTGRIQIVRRDNPNQAWAKGTERTIPVLHNRRDVQDTLRAYLLEEYPPEAEKIKHGMLLVNLEGKHVGLPMSAGRVNRLFQQLHARTGIKAHPHLFRHTFATRMLQSGYLDQYVQQLLGHRSISTTKDIYSHVLAEMDLSKHLGENEAEG